MKLSYSSLEEISPPEEKPILIHPLIPERIEPLSAPVVMLWGVVGLVALLDFLKDIFN